MAKKGQPKWDLGQDYRSGLKAYELAQEFKAQLDPRLPAGLLEGLKEDLAAISMIEGEAGAEVDEIKGYTGTQNQHCRKGVEFASAVREALKRGKASSDVLKAAGVGGRMNEGKVSSVVAGVAAIVKAYEKFPEEFRRAGVLPADIEAAGRILVSLNAADMTQETAKVTKTGSTSARNTLRKRVEAAVDTIRGAGIMEFRDNKSTAARFAALVPPGGKPPKNPPPTEEKKA